MLKRLLYTGFALVVTMGAFGLSALSTPVHAASHSKEARASSADVSSLRLSLQSEQAIVVTRTVNVHFSVIVQKAPDPRYVAPPTDCISVAGNVKVTGTNTENVTAVVTNNCFASVTSGFVELTVKDNCSYVGRGANSVENLPSPWGVGGSFSRTFAWNTTSVCEYCKNGVPVLWPSFSVNNDIYAQGQAVFQGRSYTVTGDWQDNNVPLANSSNYSIPCP